MASKVEDAVRYATAEPAPAGFELRVAPFAEPAQMEVDTEANAEVPRSKFRIFAIMSALFVSQSNVSSVKSDLLLVS